MKKLMMAGLAMVVVGLFSGCVTTQKAGECGCQMTKYKPELLMQLPEYVPTPDGMTICRKGNIFLSAPNFNNKDWPGVLLKIDKKNNLSVFMPVPVHADTGHGCPMGLDFGPDGNLYYADNQYFYDKDSKSRLMRVVMKDGKPVRTEVAVDGFKLSNAVVWKGNTVYVSDTFFDVPGTPEGKGKSGIFAITLEEMNKGTVHLKGNMKEPHLIAHFTTTANSRGDVAGADGMTLDGKGNLYTGNFGDGVMSRITFDANGKVVSNRIISRAITCCDGIFYDAKRDVIYITDSAKNAIHTMDPETGKIATLWENEDTDGMDGLLDQPCEAVVRDGKMIIVNFDMPFPGLKNTSWDGKSTLSVINLK
ncbi:MAG: SMP-30/gluconolactonase/LRE family protein [Kiritimatiellales bacterium]|nr:SMP-30/gluconolactonase/LRE family protein [Kiritimatiellales bacterium]